VSTALVTGGSGYFGSLLVGRLVAAGHTVRILDLNDDTERPDGVELVQGDIRAREVVRAAVAGVDVVFNNVAQVPLAKDLELLRTVNVDGTVLLLDECRRRGVGKVVHTSSSAVFGVPRQNPVLPTMVPSPVEEYGHAKLAAEWACLDAVRAGLDVTIVRPRTILGHGRLGIFGILFEWVADGADVFVLGDGTNLYQFVHADDLADACLRAGERAGPATYNIGAERFGTMRELLTGLDQLLLGVASFGCVANDTGKSNETAVVVTDRGKHASDKERRSILPDSPSLHLALAFPTSQFERPVRFAGAALVGPIQHTEMFADDFFRGVTDYLLRRLVPTGHVPGGVEKENSVIRNAIDENLIMSFEAFEGQL